MSNAIENLSLGIVAIESIWYKPNGVESNELAGNKQKGVTRQKIYDGENSGYYRIIPINLISFSTGVSTSQFQNEFNVSFTLDQLIIEIAVPYSQRNSFANKFLGEGVGTPVKKDDYIFYIQDIIAGRFERRSKLITEASLNKEDVKDLTVEISSISYDEKLGLARFHVNGSSSMFSVEDIVRPNDTVTVWLYHDPSDMRVGSFGGNVTAEIQGIQELAYRDFSHIIGNGTRDKQFELTAELSDRTEAIVKLGLIEDIISNSFVPGSATRSYRNAILTLVKEAILSYTSADRKSSAVGSADGDLEPYFPLVADAPTVLVGDLASEKEIISGKKDISLTTDDISMLKVMGYGVKTGVSTIIRQKGFKYFKPLAAIAVYRYLQANFGNKEISIQMMRAISIYYNNIGFLENINYTTTAGTPRFDGFNIDFIFDKVSNNAEKLFEKPLEIAFNKSTKTNYFQEIYTSLVELCVLLRNASKAYTESRKDELVFNTQNAGETAATRKIISTKNHGETGYKVFSGHVSNISAKIGNASGSYVVSLSGAGLEKPLITNSPYFPKQSEATAIVSANMDFTTIYSQIDPIRAMEHFILRWCPRFLEFDSPSEVSTLNQKLLNSRIINLPNGKTLTKGSLILKGIFTSLENSRIFNPLNFIDIGRIREAIRVLDNSDTTGSIVEITGAIRVNGETSLYANLKQMVSDVTHEFYMDETGRVTLKYCFLAWEKTPRPEVTPTISDDMIISGANFSESDDEVVTYVTVEPKGYFLTQTDAGLDIAGQAIPKSLTEAMSDTQSFGFKESRLALNFKVKTLFANLKQALITSIKGEKKLNIFQFTRATIGAAATNRESGVNAAGKGAAPDFNKILSDLKKSGLQISYKYTDEDKKVKTAILFGDEAKTESAPAAQRTARGQAAPKAVVASEKFSTNINQTENFLYYAQGDLNPNFFVYRDLSTNRATGDADIGTGTDELTLEAVTKRYLRSNPNIVVSSGIRQSESNFQAVSRAFIEWLIFDDASFNKVFPRFLFEVDNDLSKLESVKSEKGGGVYDRKLGLSIPFQSNELAKLKNSLSPELFRYGYRPKVIQDIFSVSRQSAEAKAQMYYEFYKKPVKKANITIPANPSYRVGNTVLVTCKTYDIRSQTRLYKEFLNWIPNDDVKLDLYVGHDDRILQNIPLSKDDKGVYPGAKTPWATDYSAANFWGIYKQNPKKFIAAAIRATLKYIFNDIKVSIPKSNQDVTPFEFITLEYFPTTLWYYLDLPEVGYKGSSNVYNPETGVEISGNEVRRFHSLVFRAAFSQVTNFSLISNQEINELNTKVYDNPRIEETIQMQNHRATSYYINSVKHSYDFGSNITTSLGLTHGQDNIVIRDPLRGLTFGFMSAERRIRIGSAANNGYMPDNGAFANIYKETHKADNDYINSSFMYRSQILRNSAIYQHKVAFYEGNLNER